ncbi:hypothetical protein [Butyrivibrio sp. WCE2006]|uniref:hypothetical protein n=1 Tax=Butyrivibrio sp. WCE2006 TaxID=1410611 RepID=UPI0005D1F7F0|nr:hypothetical protein [Butyrivibrio sp. WCE2006]
MVRAEDIVWKPLYCNNMISNGLSGYYTLMFKEQEYENTFTGYKWTITFQYKENKTSKDCLDQQIEAYILHLNQYRNLEKLFEYPDPTPIGGDATFISANVSETERKKNFGLYDSVNNTGDFIRAYSTLDDAKNGALERCKWYGLDEDTALIKGRNSRKKAFIISGSDFDKLTLFKKQHSECGYGTAGDKMIYSFIPTGIGTAITVECSCGQKLMLGDFLDRDETEYNAAEHEPLTSEDIKNAEFEDAANKILFLKNPRRYRAVSAADQTFEAIYNYAVGVAAYADERIAASILYKESLDELHRSVKNYTGDDEEDIKRFYNYFECRIREELGKYKCTNKKILEALSE